MMKVWKRQKIEMNDVGENCMNKKQKAKNRKKEVNAESKENYKKGKKSKKIK